MTLDATGAGLVVGGATLVVVAWAAWLSVGSSRNGPEWALGLLSRWKALPWVVALVGLVLVVAVRPRWAGLAVVYIGLVTGWLARSVRVRLEHVRDTYGEFDAPTAATLATSQRTGAYLLATAVVVFAGGALALSAGGWAGGLAVLVAVCLAAAGLLVRRRE